MYKAIPPPPGLCKTLAKNYIPKISKGIFRYRAAFMRRDGTSRGFEFSKKLYTDITVWQELIKRMMVAHRIEMALRGKLLQDA